MKKLFKKSRHKLPPEPPIMRPRGSMSKTQEAIFGFYEFAYLPTFLTSGKLIWLSWYFVAGRKFGGFNRFYIGNKSLEIKYFIPASGRLEMLEAAV